MDDEKILIIDWKNKDGSGEYSIRYTLDIEKGNFIVTGDVGYCIASWYNHLTPDNLCKFLNNIVIVGLNLIHTAIKISKMIFLYLKMIY